MIKQESIFCACGCNEKRLKYDRRGRNRKFIKGHASKIFGFKKGADTWNQGLTKADYLGKKTKQKTGKELNCDCCSKLIYVQKWKLSQGRYFCSRECSYKKMSKYSNENGYGKWMSGKKIPTESIRKREKTKIKRRLEEGYVSPHKGKPAWNKGIPHTKEHKKKLKEARRYQILPKKDTTIEVKIQNFLKQLGIEFFTHQYMKEIEHGYQCDILIPSMNLVIECDGDYWHKYPIGREIDHIRTKELIDKGFKVLRLWENEIREMNLTSFKNRINF